MVGNLTLLAVNVSTLTTLETIPDTLDRLGSGRAHAAEIALALLQLGDENPEFRRSARVSLRELISEVDQRFEVLLKGDPSQGLQPVRNAESQAQIRSNQQHWQRETLPLIEELLMERDVTNLRPKLIALREPLTVLSGNTARIVAEERQHMQERITQSRWLQFGFGVVLLVVLIIATWIMRRV